MRHYFFNVFSLNARLLIDYSELFLNRWALREIILTIFFDNSPNSRKATLKQMEK